MANLDALRPQVEALLAEVERDRPIDAAVVYVSRELGPLIAEYEESARAIKDAFDARDGDAFRDALLRHEKAIGARLDALEARRRDVLRALGALRRGLN